MENYQSIIETFREEFLIRIDEEFREGSLLTKPYKFFRKANEVIWKEIAANNSLEEKSKLKNMIKNPYIENLRF